MRERRGWMRCFAAVVTAALGLVWFAGAAPAGAAGDDYPHRGAASCAGQFGQYSWCVDENSNGSFSSDEQWSSRNFAYRNCTDWVAWRLNNTNGVAFDNHYGGRQWGNANNWDDTARALGITVNSTPARGAVAQTDAGGYGHVAWVSAVNSNGTVTIEEYNGSGTGAYRQRSAAVSEFRYIHIKDLADTPAERRSTSDFNGDGRSDLAWYEANKNIATIWGGSSPGLTQGWAKGFAKPVWAGTGDFNGDGRSDIAWYEANRNIAMVWGGTSPSLKQGWAKGLGAPVWAGTGDFNGDGKTDIAWYEANKNMAMIWGGTSPGLKQGWAKGLGAPVWAGTGDFNGDGKTDIAWYEANKNIAIIWGGASPGLTQGWAKGFAKPVWAGTGDFNGDGRSDIAWYEANRNIAMVWGGTSPSLKQGWAKGIGAPVWAAGTGSFPGTNGNGMAAPIK